MTADDLTAALRACAAGIYPLEAGVALLISNGTFITTGISISDGVTLLASTGCEAAIGALNAGELPASSGERRMLLLAASIAGGTPVSLCDTLTGIDRRNASLVVSAVAHAAAGRGGCTGPGRGQSVLAGGMPQMAVPAFIVLWGRTAPGRTTRSTQAGMRITRAAT